jgi:galactonate dehydratase
VLPEVKDGSVAPIDAPGLGMMLKPELFERDDATVRVTRA